MTPPSGCAHYSLSSIFNRSSEIPPNPTILRNQHEILTPPGQRWSPEIYHRNSTWLSTIYENEEEDLEHDDSFDAPERICFDSVSPGSFRVRTMESQRDLQSFLRSERGISQHQLLNFGSHSEIREADFAKSGKEKFSNHRSKSQNCINSGRSRANYKRNPATLESIDIVCQRHYSTFNVPKSNRSGARALLESFIQYKPKKISCQQDPPQLQLPIIRKKAFNDYSAIQKDISPPASSGCQLVKWLGKRRKSKLFKSSLDRTKTSLSNRRIVSPMYGVKGTSLGSCSPRSPFEAVLRAYSIDKKNWFGYSRIGIPNTHFTSQEDHQELTPVFRCDSGTEYNNLVICHSNSLQFPYSRSKGPNKSHFLQNSITSEDSSSKLSYFPLHITPSSFPPVSTLHPFDDCGETFDITAIHDRQQKESLPLIHQSVQMAGLFPDTAFEMEEIQMSSLTPLLAEGNEEKRSNDKAEKLPTENGDDSHKVGNSGPRSISSEMPPGVVERLFTIFQSVGWVSMSSLFQFAAYTVDLIAIQGQWSPIWITTGVLVGQLALLMGSEFFWEVKSETVDRLKSRRRIASSVSITSSPDSLIGESGTKFSLSRRSSAITDNYDGGNSEDANVTYLEGICLRSSEALQFNLEYVDIVLPTAFLYFLLLLNPLLIMKNCLGENGICEGLSMLPAIVLVSMTLTAQFIRAASRTEVEPSLPSTFPVQNLDSMFKEEIATFPSQLGPLQPQSTSNTLLILGPQISSEDLESVGRMDTQHLFAPIETHKETRVTSQFHLPEPRFGFTTLIRDACYDGFQLFKTCIISISHAPEALHLILFSCGGFLYLMYQAPSFTTVLLLAHGGISLLLKRTLNSASTQFLLRQYRLSFEYHLCIVELFISLVFLILSLNQFFIESLILSDVLIWKMSKRNALTYTQFLTIFAAIVIHVFTNAFNNRMVKFPQEDVSSLLNSSTKAGQVVPETILSPFPPKQTSLSSLHNFPKNPPYPRQPQPQDFNPVPPFFFQSSKCSQPSGPSVSDLQSSGPQIPNLASSGPRVSHLAQQFSNIYSGEYGQIQNSILSPEAILSSSTSGVSDLSQHLQHVQNVVATPEELLYKDGLKKFRWSEVISTFLWFLLAEVIQIVFNSVSSREGNVASITGVVNPYFTFHFTKAESSLLGMDQSYAIRYLSAALIFFGLFHSVLVRNHHTSAKYISSVSSDSTIGFPIARSESVPEISEVHRVETLPPVTFLGDTFDAASVHADDTTDRSNKSKSRGVRWFWSRGSQSKSISEKTEQLPEQLSASSEMGLNSESDFKLVRMQTRAENQRGNVINEVPTASNTSRFKEEGEALSAKHKQPKLRGTIASQSPPLTQFIRSTRRAETMKNFSDE